MSPEASEMVSKYPTLFKEIPRSGVYVAPGWLPVINRLCYILEHHIVALPNEERKEMYCVQIKEKFGGLRFYMNRSDAYIDGAIAMTESVCNALCEECGALGTRRDVGYIQTLCDKHAEEKAQKKK